jgi:hypothetical protein
MVLERRAHVLGMQQLPDMLRRLLSQRECALRDEDRVRHLDERTFQWGENGKLPRTAIPTLQQQVSVIALFHS